VLLRGRLRLRKERVGSREKAVVSKQEAMSRLRLRLRKKEKRPKGWRREVGGEEVLLCCCLAVLQSKEP
jgi:hypothetical protein